MNVQERLIFYIFESLILLALVLFQLYTAGVPFSLPFISNTSHPAIQQQQTPTPSVPILPAALDPQKRAEYFQEIKKILSRHHRTGANRPYRFTVAAITRN